MYFTRMPVPCVDKLPQRSSEQDAAEAARNKDWNPNAPLAGAVPHPVVASDASPASADPASKADKSGVAPTAETPVSNRDPAAILNDQGSTSTPAPPGITKSEITGLFIQAGAYWRYEDAEQQRAKLAMLGLSSRIFERDQSGRSIYRIRLGPFENRESTLPTLDRLQAAGIETTLVRVERTP